MIRNGKDIADGAVVSTQVCIMGSCPAGITAAWYLQKAGLNVTLIEGSRDFGADWKASWPDKKLLYNGTAEGLQGVVDVNLKVHCLGNLYVAGSSVFPSAGISNPTFAIITLSIRLAEHLTAALGT